MTPEARLAYLLDPTDWRAASVYGTALVQAGRIAAGRRVMREACFFSPESRCNLTVEAS
jgi:Flp pilus assembly protein TadD